MLAFELRVEQSCVSSACHLQLPMCLHDTCSFCKDSTKVASSSKHLASQIPAIQKHSHVAGISAADEVPQQKSHKPSAAAKTLDSDEVSESDEASDSEMPGSDGNSGEDAASDSDEADEVLPSHSSKAQQSTAPSRSSLEERRVGMPAETSGQPAVTPGEQLFCCTGL